MIDDRPHVFGFWDHLLGVYTPAEGTAADRDPQPLAMVFLTPGMLHHVGPFGLHVEVGRALAEEGIASFRFCLSGIGESFGVGDAHCSTARAVIETRQAMDFLEREYGIERFLLFGLCSGADDSVNTALADTRVVGLSLLDACSFPTWQFLVRRWGIHQPRKLWQRLAHPLRERDRLERTTDWPTTLIGGDDIREFPPQQQAEAEIQQLVDRGVDLLFLYTGGLPKSFNHERQFYEMFPRLEDRGRVRVEHYPDFDHTLRLIEDRQAIVAAVAKWVAQRADPRWTDPRWTAEESLAGS